MVTSRSGRGDLTREASRWMVREKFGSRDGCVAQTNSRAIALILGTRSQIIFQLNVVRDRRLSMTLKRKNSAKSTRVFQPITINLVRTNGSIMDLETVSGG
ncbi:MAG: hypothetical protein CM1200mP25_0160 [Acidobacteriota bacterium]|nr:MAG: hypothetical protein CM1200mP25_0160 [Acidobacteriota bacterium]